jgi:hypothetical protein
LLRFGIQKHLHPLASDRHLINTIYQPRFSTVMEPRHNLRSISREEFSLNTRNIVIAIGVVALAIAWYAFRPELLFVNKTVSEEFPGGPAMASIEKGPIALTKWSFKGLAHETKGLASIYQLAEGDQIRPAAGSSNKAAAGIRAFYFKDRDGHNLEIIYFPLGNRGFALAERERQALSRHRSHGDCRRRYRPEFKFYRDLLGFKLAGESMNYGTEQEHLNNVEGRAYASAVSEQKVARG